MWSYVSCLKRGVSHVKDGTPCQDSVAVREDENCIAAALADGLGSLKNSELAATLATKTACDLLVSLGKNRLSLGSKENQRKFAACFVKGVTDGIREEAAKRGVEPRTMDCTLLFVYISKVHHYAVIGRLGDSAVCVIRSGSAFCLNDGNPSANGTCAILDEDAADRLDIRCWDLAKEDIAGFILTSDGLDNELYRKGSDHVNKAAEVYFNAVAVSQMPRKVIEERIASLTAGENTPFDDDISIVVLSRARTPMEFAADPTWLCSCGTRNRLQDTYCKKCFADFSRLYQNVRFREYGGKTAFFLELNRHPGKERALVMPNINQGKKRPQKEVNQAVKNQKTDLQMLIALVAVVCLVLGGIAGGLFVRAGQARQIHALEGSVLELEERVEELENLRSETLRPTEPEAPTEPTQEETPEEPPVAVPNVPERGT